MTPGAGEGITWNCVFWTLVVQYVDRPSIFVVLSLCLGEGVTKAFDLLVTEQTLNKRHIWSSSQGTSSGPGLPCELH